MQRRKLLLGGLGVAAAAAAGAVLLRPGDEGAPYDSYFAGLNEELKRNGPMHPCMLIDLDRLDHNLDQVTASVAKVPGRNLRLVEKSLPSAGLLSYAMARTGSKRLMSFHQPFLSADATAFPDADLLVGKPLPARAAQLFYQQHRGRFDPATQLQWLIDTPENLQAYLALAKALGTRLQVNLELDVGLHRGGIAETESLAAVLKIIAANSEHLRFSGFMGYDPHVVKLPSFVGTPMALVQQVMLRYQSFVDFTKQQYAALWTDHLTLNTAGSPSYRLHEAETLATEVAVGSGLVKAADFDIPTLATHQPACFIATPVLKAENGPLRIPGIERVGPLFARWDINQSRAWFLYGGYWLANYESPKGLRRNAIYGHSTNQENVTASASVNLKVGDQVFLRPTQSEFVFLQFGDLLAVRKGRIVDRWPVYSG